MRTDGSGPATVSGQEGAAVTQTIGGGPAGTGPDADLVPGRRPGRFDVLRAALSRPGVAELLVGGMALVVFSWQVGRPSPWFDEAVTRDVTSRPAGEILSLARHVDLVHTAYYLLVHALLGASASVTPIRMISVVAAAVTAVLLVRIGRELGSARVGLTAGCAWVITPLVTRYAQEARPYALVALAATAATLALVRLCRRPWLPRRWVAYTAALVVLGLLNAEGLLLVAVHLVHVLATSSAAVRRRWYLAVACALGLLSPYLVAAVRQAGQVSWLPEPDLAKLTGFWLAQYATGSAVVAALLVLALATLGRGTHSGALALGLTWALLPPAVLWAASQVHPLFDWRYLFFTVPGGALALGSLATLLQARWVGLALAAVALGGLHMQHVYRLPATGHAEDLRGAARMVDSGARPGDAVMFLPVDRRVVELAYPRSFAAADDVMLAATGEESDTLLGVELPPDRMAAALRGHDRVWVVTGPARLGEGPDAGEQEKERLLYNGFRLTGLSLTRSFEVRRYERGPSASGVPAAIGSLAGSAPS